MSPSDRELAEGFLVSASGKPQTSRRERAEGFRESNADTRYLHTERDEDSLRNETAPTETDQTNPQEPTAHGGRGVFTGPLGGGSMPQLSACYFCGTALDDPVDDYPIVPEDLRTENADPTTVTLCQSCHEKLDAIVAELGDAFRTAQSDSPTVDAQADADDLLVEPDTEPTASSASPRTDADVNAVPDPRQTDEPATETGPEEQSSTHTEPGTSESTAAAPDAGAAGDSKAADDAGDADDASNADDAEDAERAVVEGKHDISALEYNKVMRLLQNREFPVDREEIEIVAANAYQVARSDCATVIDVAVDRGLIAEENGQLVKPEDA